MLEVILDTETTGLSTTEKHKIVEIGCVELDNQISTNKIFHEYINPQRSVSEEAYKVHGYSDKFLSDKKTFPEIAESFLSFIKDKKIIIHNAAFDLSFLNYELKKEEFKIISMKFESKKVSLYGNEIANKGIITIKSPVKILQMLYDAGIGAKRSQGFGMLEVVKQGN